MSWKQIAISLLFLGLHSTVIPQNNSEKLFELAGYTFPYQINTPDKHWTLPKDLVEISGLSYIGKHRLASIQDEKGKIYLFNTKKGMIEEKIPFGDKGDYEAIEVVSEDAWILKSNGTLFRVKDFLKDKDPKIHKYKTGLTGRNNTEGLGYDPHRNCLLIACKGYPFIEDDDELYAKEYKAIYCFDLKTKQLDKTPALIITLDSIKQFKNYNTMATFGIELLAFLDAAEGDVSFKPSAIAVHPRTGNIYVLASAGNLLAVFSGNGKLLALIHLKSKVHLQPEGICFTPEGKLYISNEGGDGKGVIMTFNEKLQR